MGGLGIGKPTEECMIAHTNSMYVCAPLVRLIQRQEHQFDPSELLREVKGLRTDVDKEADARFKTKLDLILNFAPSELKLAVQAASEKGASSWVTAVPSYEHGTVLHKSDFVDACYMRYGWQPLDLPQLVQAESYLVFNILSIAHLAVCVQYSTMKSVTLWLNACAKLDTQQWR